MSNDEQLRSLEVENARLRQRVDELKHTPKPSPWPVILLLFGLTAGMVALLICGIPFVRPASGTASSLGICGALVAGLSLLLAFRTRQLGCLFLLFASFVLSINYFAFSLGKQGKHLIDYLEHR